VGEADGVICELNTQLSRQMTQLLMQTNRGLRKPPACYRFLAIAYDDFFQQVQFVSICFPFSTLMAFEIVEIPVKETFV
jgi:hypothetical protein